MILSRRNRRLLFIGRTEYHARQWKDEVSPTYPSTWVVCEQTSESRGQYPDIRISESRMDIQETT